MVDRKHISLIYQYNDNWIGGTYYILNIIRALNSLPDESKPFLTIYYNLGSSLKDLDAIHYPYISYVEFNSELPIVKKAVNKLTEIVFNAEIFSKKLPALKVDNFYFMNFGINNTNIDKFYFWIADLQDLYLPHFFKPAEIKKRLKNYARLVKEKQPIVFSSKAALNDFDKFYPDNNNLKKVLQFVSIANTDYEKLSFNTLKEKFGITRPYFIVSNQFWKHKNHKTVLKAFKLFNNQNVQLLLTGKEYDYRDPHYTDELKKFVVDNDLSDSVSFLGFIDRNEQLKLMSESIAVIQPSLFEGWSTVVEDAKFLNKTVICSSIDVHKEQLPVSDLFFNPENEHELMSLMVKVTTPDYAYNSSFNHETAVTAFANNFIELFN